jgi:hypothetical protein
MGESSGQAGYGADGVNAFVMLDASCSMVIGEIVSVWTNAVNGSSGIMTRTAHQGMGFSDSPRDTSERGEQFVNNVNSGMSNQAAWLDAAECSNGCDQSPAILTIGNNESNAYTRANTESILLTFSDPLAGYWAWTWIDNDDC